MSAFIKILLLTLDLISRFPCRTLGLPLAPL